MAFIHYNYYMLERDGPKKINTTRTSWRLICWGVVLALLASMWIYGAVNPSPGENRYLFAVLAIFAAIGSVVILLDGAPKFMHSVGVGFSWLFWLIMAGLVGAAIVSFIAGAPIPAAIIVGALIIAAAIKQSE